MGCCNWVEVYRINKGNVGVVEDFNKIKYYKSCLKNPQAQVRTCSVGGLKLDERVLALIVTWILTPRGSNHSVLTGENLIYIYCIMKKVKINWIHIIKEHMQKSMRLNDYHYPYAVLISTLFWSQSWRWNLWVGKINTRSEQWFTKKNGFHQDKWKMGKQRWWSWWFLKCCNFWFDEEHQVADMNIHNEKQPATDFDAGTSVGHQGDGIPSMSSFERYMVDRLDGFAKNQINLHDLCVKNF